MKYQLIQKEVLLFKAALLLFLIYVEFEMKKFIDIILSNPFCSPNRWNPEINKGICLRHSWEKIQNISQSSGICLAECCCLPQMRIKGSGSKLLCSLKDFKCLVCVWLCVS